MVLPTITANAPVIPNFIWVVEVPERPADLAKRYHNKYAKEALAEAMEYHHEKHIPRHFTRPARRLYNYQPRDEKYIRIKRKRFPQSAGLDMRKRNNTQRLMTTQYKLRMGGSASGENLSANMTLRFPFRGGTGRRRKTNTKGGVTIQQMILEMQRFADDEPPKLAQKFHQAYWKKVDNHRKTRKRLRVPTK